MSFLTMTITSRTTRSKPYDKPCAYCGQLFNKQYNLKRHIQLHTGVKPFTCAQCPRRFHQKTHLVKHIQTHHGDGHIHTCAYKPLSNESAGCYDIPCGQVFPSTESYNRHCLVHHTEAGRRLHVPDSEQLLAKFFDLKGLRYSPSAHNYTKFPTGHCYIDFILHGPEFIILVENDEHEHKGYDVKKDIQRTLGIRNHFKTTSHSPVILIRFNPHRYVLNGSYVHPELTVRHEALYMFITTELQALLVDTQRFAFHIKYMYYSDTTKIPDVLAPYILV